MSTKKPDMRGMKAMMGSSANETTKTGVDEVAPGKIRNKVGSLHSPAMAQPRKERQVYYLSLPVSKKEIKCELAEFDPDSLVVAPFNMRSQELLSPDSSSIKSLVDSMGGADGQREPILVRRNGAGRQEVVYGSCRRFASSILNTMRKDEGGFRVKAWYYPDISDDDARALSHSENENREDISPWERGKFYLAELKRLGCSQAFLAEQNNVSEGTVNECVRVAALPVELVSSMVSPSLITIRGGVRLARLINKAGPSGRKRVFETLQPNMFNDLSLLEKHCTGVLDNTQKKIAERVKSTAIEHSNGTVAAVIKPHRTKEGQYKLDLFGFSSDQVAAVSKAIEKIVK